MKLGYITETVAIGDASAPHDAFRVIVCADCPVEEGIRRTVLGNKQILYQLNIKDLDAGQIENLLTMLRRDWKKDRHRHILFQCEDSGERSTSVAISFLMRTTVMPLSQILDRIMVQRGYKV